MTVQKAIEKINGLCKTGHIIRNTDKEIIKALECCQHKTYSHCKECVFCGSPSCNSHLATKALDLINRQQAEIIETRRDLLKEFVHEILSPFKDKAYLSKRDLEIIVEHLAKYY